MNENKICVKHKALRIFHLLIPYRTVACKIYYICTKYYYQFFANENMRSEKNMHDN